MKCCDENSSTKVLNILLAFCYFFFFFFFVVGLLLLLFLMKTKLISFSFFINILSVYLNLLCFNI